MTKIWVLVADSSRAKLLGAKSPIGALQELESFDHPAARQHVQDLTTDLPGRTFDSAGQGRHAMEPKTDPKQHEALNFAKFLSERLATASADNTFERLVLVAAPAFLGLLRGQLSASVRKRISVEIDKDLAGLNAQAIRAHLPDRI